ncbi:MAG: methyltransferase [Myxococcales bacterium]|nr:methyltransferase [Myxococcales bacterium]
MHAQEDLTDDALAGHFRVFQRRKGHRYSLDDTLTAAVAAQRSPEATRVLDLGCGLGSVLLMLAYKLPKALLWGVEAQAESFALCKRNVARNGVDDRVVLTRGDLRDEDLIAAVRADAAVGVERAAPGFELVTGTPPYQPVGKGTVSPDPQRAHARVELRGGVEAYLAAAAQAVDAQGWVVVCADARTPERVEQGAAAVGLAPVRRLDAVPIAEHKGPLFSVFTLRPEAAHDGSACVVEPRFEARNAWGGRTDSVLELRRFFDLPVDENEPASPRQKARSQEAGD